jgi:ABC-type transport system substrate-binding protein
MRRKLNGRGTAGVLAVSIVTLMAAVVACGGGTEEVIREVEVERIVEKEVVKEVPVERVVEKEVVKEVPVEKIVIQEKTVEVEAPFRDTVRAAMGTIPFHLVPGVIPSLQSRTSWTPMWGMFGVQDETDGSIVPYMASWELIGGDIVRLSIEPGQMFHNGEELTAVGTVEQIDFLNAQQKFGFVNWNLWAGWDAWEATDEYTLEAVMKEPNARFDRTFGVHVPLPPKYLSDAGPPGFSDKPVGSGPYEFVDWERDSHLKMTRWEDYKGGHPSAVGGLPVIKEIEFRFVPEDAVRAAGLQAGDFDIAAVLPPEQVARLLKSGYRIFAGDSQQSFTVWLGSNTWTHEALKDVRVRRAMHHAVDIDKIYEQIAGGYGTQLQCQLVAENGFGYNSSLRNYEYDVDKAKALLKEAGYEDGFSVQGSSSVARYYRDDQVMTALQSYWADIGIEMPIQYLESAVWLEAAMEGTLPPLWNIGLNWWMSDNTNIAVKAGVDPELDEIRKQATLTLDKTKRVGMVRDAAARGCDQAYGMWFYTIPALFGLNPDLPDITFNLAFEMIIPTE